MCTNVSDSCLFVILLDLDFFQGKKKNPKAFHTGHEFKLSQGQSSVKIYFIAS